MLKEAKGKKKLSEAEAKELENELRHDINTQFGTRNENFALSVYERRSGTEVRAFVLFFFFCSMASQAGKKKKRRHMFCDLYISGMEYVSSFGISRC